VDEVYNKIQAMAEDGNGFVKTSQIEAAGINRAVLKKYVDSGLLERIRKGIYAPADCDIDEFAYRLQAQGLDLKTYLQYTGMDNEKFREGFKARAEKQVKLDLALKKIIEVEKIEVSEEDIEAEYKKFAEAYNMEIDAIQKAIPADNLKPEIASRKAVDLIVENAVVTEEKATKKAAAKKADTADSDADAKAPAKKSAAKKTAAKKTAKKEEADAE